MKRAILALILFASVASSQPTSPSYLFRRADTLFTTNPSLWLSLHGLKLAHGLDSIYLNMAQIRAGIPSVFPNAADTSKYVESNQIGTASGMDSNRVATNDYFDKHIDSTSIYIGNNASIRENGNGMTAVGFDALQNNTSGFLETGVGYKALEYNTTGFRNTAVGAYAARMNLSGNHLTAIGAFSLSSNVSGMRNTGLGYATLYGNLTGSYNTAVGYASRWTATRGDYNTTVGYYSQMLDSISNKNSSLGYFALYSNNGDGNTAVGYAAQYGNTEGVYNSSLGHAAGYENTTGSYNIFLGYNAGNGYQTTQDNQFIAGSYWGAIWNVYFGEGVKDSTPSAYTINGTGAMGTNVAGGGLTLSGGISTGSGAGGALSFKTTPAGSVGVSSNTPVERMNIASTGSIAFDTDNLFIDAANNKVIIGNTVTASTEKLTIYDGVLRFNGSASNRMGLFFDRGASLQPNATQGAIFLQYNGGGSYETMTFRADGYKFQSEDSADAITIDTAGTVTIADSLVFGEGRFTGAYTDGQVLGLDAQGRITAVDGGTGTASPDSTYLTVSTDSLVALSAPKKLVLGRAGDSVFVQTLYARGGQKIVDDSGVLYCTVDSAIIANDVYAWVLWMGLQDSLNARQRTITNLTDTSKYYERADTTSGVTGRLATWAALRDTASKIRAEMPTGGTTGSTGDTVKNFATNVIDPPDSTNLHIKGGISIHGTEVFNESRQFQGIVDSGNINIPNTISAIQPLGLAMTANVTAPNLNDTLGYGGIYIEDADPDTMTVTALNVFKTVKGWTSGGVLYGATAQDSSLTIQNAGMYDVRWMLTVDAINFGDDSKVNGYIYVNDSKQSKTGNLISLHNSLDYKTMSGFGLLNLTAGQILKVKIASIDDNSGTIYVRYANLTAIRVN
jgi:hypothetical protein